MHLISIS